MKTWIVSLGLSASLAIIAPVAAAQNGDELDEPAAAPACTLQLNEDGTLVRDENGAPVYDEGEVRVLDADGAPILGEDGEPLTQACSVPVVTCPLLLDDDGQPVLSEAGLARYDESAVALLDGEGEPRLDGDGEVVTVACEVPVYACPLTRDADGFPVRNEDGTPVFDESAQPVLGEDGEPVITAEGEPLLAACTIERRECPQATDEDGNPATDEAGAPVYEDTELPILNAQGEPVLDAEGEPMLLACAIPVMENGGMDAAADLPEEDVRQPNVFDPIMRLINAGGPIIVILALLAVLSIGVALVKLVQFTWLGVGRSGFVSSMVEKLRGGDNTGAIRELDDKRSPVARVMAASLRGKTNDQMSDELVREETTRVAQAQLDGLERGLAFLSLIATIAPLLGLLGTVLGMIEAFQQMETVGDRIEPALLAGGIWEALLTTAAGLTVAIPAAVFFTWFQRAVDVEAQRMEDAATQVFTAPLYDASGEAVRT